MIKAGEAGGSLENILQRLAEFKERTQGLKNKVIGAMMYPVMVVLFTIGILTFIMLFIIPQFRRNVRGIRNRTAGDDRPADENFRTSLSVVVPVPVDPDRDGAVRDAGL